MRAIEVFDISNWSFGSNSPLTVCYLNSFLIQIEPIFFQSEAHRIFEINLALIRLRVSSSGSSDTCRIYHVMAPRPLRVYPWSCCPITRKIHSQALLIVHYIAAYQAIRLPKMYLSHMINFHIASFPPNIHFSAFLEIHTDSGQNSSFVSPVAISI